MHSEHSSPRKSLWAIHLPSRSLGGSSTKTAKPTVKHERSHSTPTAYTCHYPATPQLNETVDTTPFSDSFSALLRFSPYRDDTFASAPNLSDQTVLGVSEHRKMQAPIRREASYVVEAVSDIRDVDSEWDDDDVVEVMVVRNNGKNKKNEVPTSPSSPESPVNHHGISFASASPSSPAMTDNFSIIRTLHYSSTRTDYLAYATKLSELVVIRANKLPVLEKAQAERDTLRAISEVDCEDKSPYLQRMLYAWQDEQAAYLVTPHLHGGNLLQYIQTQGPVCRQLLQTWGAELACALVSLQDLGIIHGAVRLSVVSLRNGGHLVLGGFEDSMHAARASPRLANKKSSSEWHYAPEALLGWEIGPEADWWSYGIVLAWMALGQHPFALSPTEKFRSDVMKKRVLAGTSSSVALNVLDSSLRGLIEECLERNPAKRLNYVAACEHPVFADIDWGFILHETGEDLDVALPPMTYPVSDSPERPVVLTPPVNNMQSTVSPALSRIALPPSPHRTDVERRHARTLSHATSQSTFSSAHRAVLGRATRTHLPAARPISIAVPASPTSYSVLRSRSPQSSPLTPSLSISPPNSSSTHSSIQTPATTPLPHAAELKNISSPTLSEVTIDSPALSSFFGSPQFTSSPAIRPRPSNPAPDRTLPLPLLDSPTQQDESMLTVRASTVLKPAPAGLGLTNVDIDGAIEDVDEFGVWAAATSMDGAAGHEDARQREESGGRTDDEDEKNENATTYGDASSLRMRVRAKLRRRRREAAVNTPNKNVDVIATDNAVTQEDFSAIEITVPEFEWQPSDGVGLPTPPLLLLNGEPERDGLDIEADPFRASGASLVPELPACPPTPALDEGSALRKNQSFRWSALSLDQPDHTRPAPTPSPVRSVGERILRGSEALLRRSQYSLRSRWNRTPSRAGTVSVASETVLSVAPMEKLKATPVKIKTKAVSGPEPREGEPVGLGAGVRRMGRGIGFTQKSPTPPPTSAKGELPVYPGVQVWQPDEELGVPRGCYAGFSMRRRRSSARPVIEVERAQVSGNSVSVQITTAISASGTL